MRTEETLASTPQQPTPSPPASSSKGKGRAVTIEDVPEGDDDAMDEDGDEFAPRVDPDYYAEEDEEGRFFGGGLTSEQKEILNIFDGAGVEDAAAEDVSLFAIRCAGASRSPAELNFASFLSPR